MYGKEIVLFLTNFINIELQVTRISRLEILVLISTTRVQQKKNKIQERINVFVSAVFYIAMDEAEIRLCKESIWYVFLFNYRCISIPSSVNPCSAWQNIIQPVLHLCFYVQDDDISALLLEKNKYGRVIERYDVRKFLLREYPINFV